MPKKNLAVPKSKRIEILRSILKRNDWLTKEQIDQKMSLLLTCSEPDIQRSTYRDINELLLNHEIEIKYFYRDGVEIKDFDPTQHKNYFCKWIHKDRIVKEDSSASLGGVFIHCSRALENDIELASLTTGSRLLENRIHLFFDVGADTWVLSLARESLPVSLYIKRASEIKDYEVFKRIETEYGKRCVLLEIPHRVISDANDNRVGHVEIKFHSEIDIRDLNSKNGLSIAEIVNFADIEVILSELRRRQTKTELDSTDYDIDYNKIGSAQRTYSRSFILKFGKSFLMVAKV